MRQIFKIGKYLIYFWINENKPLEPIHVHISEGTPTSNATKIWITSSGGCIVCNNNSRIPEHQLRIMMEIIGNRHEEVEKIWISKFGQISYYC